MEGRKQRRKSGFTTKTEAQRYHAEIMIEGSEGETSMTLDALFDLYLKHSVGRIKNSTREGFSRDYTKHIKPYFGAKKVSKITPKDARQWQSIMISKELAHKYLVKIQRVFSAILNFGVKYYQVSSNPLQICGLPRDTSPHKEMAFWTEDEFRQFMTCVDEQLWHNFFSFLYLTGCRRGETLAITWKDVDLHKKEVRINKHINTRGVDGYEITSPKNPSSVRTVLLPDTLIANLAAFKKECEQIDGWSEEAFVFGVNRPLSITTLQRRFIIYAAKAGVKRIRIHDLRHSHASLLINKGQNILVVSQRLGHSDINKTLNTYSHLYPSAQKGLLDAINIAF